MVGVFVIFLKQTFWLLAVPGLVNKNGFLFLCVPLRALWLII
jgi:hypothetical protein